MEHREEWRTVADVEQLHQVFKGLNIGDEIALDLPTETDWIFGKIVDMPTYKDRSTRWSERKYLVVRLYNNRERQFFAEDVTEVLIKE